VPLSSTGFRKRRLSTVLAMVLRANRITSTGAPMGRIRVRTPTTAAQAAGQSSQPLPVASSMASSPAAMISQTQKGWLAWNIARESIA